MRNSNTPPKKTAIVWTTTDSQEGKSAAKLLSRSGVKVEVRNIDKGKWKRADVAAAVPGYTTLPQVVVENEVIGDLAALKAHANYGRKLAAPKVSHADRIAKASEAHKAMKAARTEGAAARSVAEKSNVVGRRRSQTEEQKTVALARAESAKAARIAHTEARVARVLAARPARG